jgi:hypothetical protein
VDQEQRAGFNSRPVPLLASWVGRLGTHVHVANESCIKLLSAPSFGRSPAANSAAACAEWMRRLLALRGSAGTPVCVAAHLQPIYSESGRGAGAYLPA